MAETHLANLDEVVGKIFDYIIVGGGTAGLCLAARLTEAPETSVLVLEAGGANLNDPDLLRPASYGIHFGNAKYDWNFKTDPQLHCDGNQFIWPRGKGLGGSSAINFLNWTMPPSDEIDDWERLGNPGWNWVNHRRYIKRAEKFVYPPDDERTRNEMRRDDWSSGMEGPLLTSFPSKIPLSEFEVRRTFINLGIPVAPKPLDGDPTGVFFAPETLDPRNATRTYSTTAYYLPNASRPNLHVLVQSTVSKLVLSTDSDNGDLVAANGVEFVHKGIHCAINVGKEVLLCAGSLKSPQILELSGIGSRIVLEKLDISCIVDLPGVGENVQEHVFAGTSFELKDDDVVETLDVLRNPELAAQHMDLHASGEGAYNIGIVGFVFAPLNLLSASASSIHEAALSVYRTKRPEVTEAGGVAEGIKQQWKIQLERLEKGSPGCEFISIPGFFSRPNLPKDGKKYLSISVAMNHMFSRGTIHSISKDPTIDPAFDPHYFEEGIDMQTFVEAMKFLKNKVAKTSPFKDSIGIFSTSIFELIWVLFGGSFIAREVNPGPEVVSDEQIGDWLKNHLSTTFHTAGSCSMLPRDKGGVVDPQLKVYGTSNIRVVDLSVVPLHIATHTQSTVYGIAEQAADIIKGVI
ncbi:GMC oxidoreductase [Jaapia argillacea MUCL 33604]|uniref:GMC oxidoreductase n=1 Tax=Jaapia argillacea MUCL 33604 TaxID=933084 RepID=A0A067PML0_9AGAM|nr:GMC oxidoreductase [Jaapia argillacea MUCL 33604]